jgi:hypothetical protein
MSELICTPFRTGSVQCSTVQYSTVQYSTVQCSSTVQYSTVQYSAAQQYSTVQYSTVQYSTVQYSTVQYSTVQCSSYAWNGKIKQSAKITDEKLVTLFVPKKGIRHGYTRCHWLFEDGLLFLLSGDFCLVINIYYLHNV